MKFKILIVLGILMIFIFGLGITYSLFQSDAKLNSNNQNIAKFIFNAEEVNEIEVPLMGLLPGSLAEYSFAVNNTKSESLSNVSIEYQLTIKTYHFIPVIIELYKIEEEDHLILTCDESYTRNDDNELVCNTLVQSMDYKTEVNDNYKLKIRFPKEYNDETYSGLVDYINVEIKSWQKIED